MIRMWPSRNGAPPAAFWSNGNAYEMSYATFVTFREGLILIYREYWNPQAFLAAMSGVTFAG